MAREKKSRWTPERVALARKLSLVGGAAALGAILIGVGLYQLRKSVANSIAMQTEPPRVVIKNRPAWMSPLLHDDLCAAARPARPQSALDRDALRQAVEALRSNPASAPWIREVRQVRLLYGRRPGDTLEIDCEFRTPVAVVRWQDRYYLVDNEGCALPKPYAPEQLASVLYGRDHRINIRIVEGVAGGPPLPGQKWQGDDLAAGLDLVKLLGTPQYRAFTEEIVKVNVANHGGRLDAREAHLVLATNHTPETQVRWGRAVRAADAMVAEVPPTQKIEYLYRVFQEYGRVDAGRQWIDIRFDRITYPISAPEAHAAR
jgi:hypothetical protein